MPDTSEKIGTCSSENSTQGHIHGNPGITHSVPTAFTVMNAVGTEWATPGLPRMSGT